MTDNKVYKDKNLIAIEKINRITDRYNYKCCDLNIKYKESKQ